METLRAIVSNICSWDRKNHISQKCIFDTISPQVFVKSIHVHLGYTMDDDEMASLKQYLNNVERPSNDNRTAIRDDVEGGEAKRLLEPSTTDKSICHSFSIKGKIMHITTDLSCRVAHWLLFIVINVIGYLQQSSQ